MTENSKTILYCIIDDFIQRVPERNTACRRVAKTGTV